MESEDLGVTLALTLVSDPHPPESWSVSTAHLRQPDSAGKTESALYLVKFKTNTPIFEIMAYAEPNKTGTMCRFRKI